jgi:hypothetical protein
MSTLEEVAHGDESRGESFHGLPLPLLHSALQELVQSNRAVLIDGGSMQETGIKFLSI